MKRNMSITKAIRKATEDVIYYGYGHYGIKDRDSSSIWMVQMRAGDDPRITIRNIRAKVAIGYIFDDDEADWVEEHGVLCSPGRLRDIVKDAVVSIETGKPCKPRY